MKLKRPWTPYVCPFVVFIILTAIGQYFPSLSYIFYVLKTLITAVLLFYFRREYQHDLNACMDLRTWSESIFAGMVVLAVWILSDNVFPHLGNPIGFDPARFCLTPNSEMIVLSIRLLGASIVVPIMEELFWRSFLMRYLINPDFKAVSVGAFTWFSFLSVTILFGLEHYHVIQGIVAGLVFSLLVIHQKNLKGAIISHGITNFGLGIYVLSTGNWHFW